MSTVDPRDVINRTLDEGGYKFKGVIIFSGSNDDFDYMPIEGYPTSEPLAAMCDVDLSKKFLSEQDRWETFELRLSAEDMGMPTRLFLRVEDSKYILPIDSPTLLS